MSIRVMTMVFDRYHNGGGEMLLALALADHSHDDGTHIYPSVKQLADKTRQSERTIQYQLRRMEESGWLILVNTGNGGRNLHREYRISPDWLKGADIAPNKKGAIDDEKGATDDKKGCKPQQERVQQVAPAYNRHRTINEPSINHKAETDGSDAPVSKPSSTKPEVSTTLPDWLPADAWAMWNRFRIAKGAKGWTEDAKALSIRDLKKLHAAGNDPQAVIEQSIQRGWTGLFEVKQANAAPAMAANQSAAQRRSDWGRRLNESIARNTAPQTNNLGDFDASGRPI